MILTNKKILLFCFILKIGFAFLNASNVDSLQLKYREATSDTVKADLLIQIGDYYEYSISDSALYYYNLAYELTKNSKKQDYRTRELEGTALRYKGVVYRQTGNFTAASLYLNMALDVFLETGNKKGLASTYSSLGALNRSLGNNIHALEYYQKALNINMEIGNERGIAACHNNIGIIHNIEKNYSLALKYYENALNYFKKQENELRIGIALMNMGSVYLAKEKLADALSHYDEAGKIFLALNNTRGLAQTHNNTAMVYVRKGKLTEAMEIYKKSLELHNEAGDLKGTAASYNNIADLYYKMKNYETSVAYAEKGLNIATNINALNSIVQSYNHLRKAYKKLNNHYWAAHYADLYITNKDSLHSVEISKAIAELETRYQSKQDQLEIENLKNENQLKESEIRVKNQLIFAVSSGLVIVILLTIIVFYQKNVKNKINTMLVKRNKDIQNKNIKIISQNNKIEDSIKYAQSIQKALLPDNKAFYSFFKDVFVFEQPSDIVSGDFYWMHPIDNDRIIFAVADCTGHGVPGAFMSVLGISLLNDIIIKHNEYDLSNILNQLRSGFITALHQDNPGHKHREGVDISICLYNKSTKELHFAAARSQLWILSKSGNNNGDFTNKNTSKPKAEIKVYKGDGIPIGVHRNNKRFNKQIIKLNSEDLSLYLLSDGYYNQLNHKTNKRYTSKRLKENLLKICYLPLKEQCKILERELHSWKGNEPQIDDITILGIKT